MRIAMVNSREYQFAFENVYLSALSLTLARFQFMIQGYSNWGAFYSPLTADGVVFNSPTHDATARSSSAAGRPGVTAAATPTPKPPNLNNQLQLAAANGFLLNLMSGGQLLVNLANSIVFEYSNKGVQVVSPNLTVSFVQPLLRGAWARVVTQGLSLQERNVLYNLRDFAEFRRQFYVSLVTGAADLVQLVVRLVDRLSCPAQPASEHSQPREKRQVCPGRISPCSRRSFRDRKARSMSRRSQTSTRGSRLRSFQRRRGFRPRSTGSRSISGCRPRSKCGSTIRPSINSSLNDERLDAMRARTEALLLRLVQSDELPPRRAGRCGRTSSKKCTTSSRRFTTRSSRSRSAGRRNSTRPASRALKARRALTRKRSSTGKRLCRPAEADACRSQ